MNKAVAEEAGHKAIYGQNNSGRSEAGPRLLAIDRARGFGIALVVWGHLATGATPGLPTWFYISVSVIYSFHMPLFMYLSGFVFFLSNSQERFWKDPAGQVWKRFDRLMVPCIVFAVIVVVGKVLVVEGNSSSRDMDLIQEGIFRVIENGPGNPVLSIWYLVVLFFYSVLTPLLTRALPKPAILLVFLGLLFWGLSFPEEFYVERIAQYFIFFAIGGCVAINRSRIEPLISAWYLPLMAIFALSCFMMLGNKLSLLVCGIAALPALHGLFLQTFWDKDQLLLFLGKNSMAIYLINTIVIGILQIFYTKYLPYKGDWFFLYSSVVFALAIAIPIIIRYILSLDRRMYFIKRYLD
jgi:fucose 4-O-acetylase-like acetyltransferase